MKEKFTQDPWFADKDGNIWRTPVHDLYQYGGSVAGDKPLAIAYKGWYGKDQVGFPVEANAALIASAPELYKALKETNEMLERILENKEWGAIEEQIADNIEVLSAARGEML